MVETRRVSWKLSGLGNGGVHVASLIILAVVFIVFLFLCGKTYADPEKREQIIRNARNETLMRKALKNEKKRQKEQAWREISQDWMVSDIWWNSFKDK